MKKETISKVIKRDKITKYRSLVLFTMGLVFDLLTLGQIDRSFYLFQHAIFLILVFLIIIKFSSDEMRSPYLKIKSIRLSPIDILQFFYGSLLSHYFYFYFRSSSLVTWLFLILVTMMLLLNELAYEKKWYLSFNVFLFPFCLLAYLVYFIPILLGSIGSGEFYLSVMLFFAIMLLMPYLFVQNKKLLKKFWISSASVLIFTVYFYQLKFIPPVPLHVTKSGIYTKVSNFEDVIITSVKEVRSFQKVSIAYLSGEKIYYAAKIFSPSNFKDKLFLEWSIKDKNQWNILDKIIFEVKGKSDGDYRGIAWKENWGIGQYKVTLVTEDGRILDEINVEVADEKSRIDWFINTNSY